MFRIQALFILFCGFIIFSSQVLAQKKAKVINNATEVYQEANFDSNIYRTVDPNESLLISNKTYGEFYKVKFKDGSIGYIPDTELDIEGVGAFEPKPYVEDVDSVKSKNKPKIKKIEEDDTEDEDGERKLIYKGLTLQLVNFHEDTLGGTQVADLLAYGFRYQPMSGGYDSAISYEFLVAPKAPDYYAEKTGGSVSGAIFWGSTQISNTLGLNSMTSFRYGAGPFARFSHFSVQNATNKPNKKYTLQDLTLGIDLQAGIMLHSRYVTMDLGLRYFWDKESYGSLGIAFLF